MDELSLTPRRRGRSAAAAHRLHQRVGLATPQAPSLRDGAGHRGRRLARRQPAPDLLLGRLGRRPARAPRRRRPPPGHLARGPRRRTGARSSESRPAAISSWSLVSSRASAAGRSPKAASRSTQRRRRRGCRPRRAPAVAGTPGEPAQRLGPRRRPCAAGSRRRGTDRPGSPRPRARRAPPTGPGPGPPWRPPPRPPSTSGVPGSETPGRPGVGARAPPRRPPRGAPRRLEPPRSSKAGSESSAGGLRPDVAKSVRVRRVSSATTDVDRAQHLGGPRARGRPGCRWGSPPRRAFRPRPAAHRSSRQARPRRRRRPGRARSAAHPRRRVTATTSKRMSLVERAVPRGPSRWPRPPPGAP